VEYLPSSKKWKGCPKQLLNYMKKNKEEEQHSNPQECLKASIEEIRDILTPSAYIKLGRGVLKE
jgi:hypothetical protein